MVILCIEYDKYGGKQPIMYVVKRNAKTNDFIYLAQRSIFSPELNYYATKMDEKGVKEETIMHLFKRLSENGILNNCCYFVKLE